MRYTLLKINIAENEQSEKSRDENRTQIVKTEVAQKLKLTLTRSRK